MYGTYNSICSLATTTAAIVVLVWFPAFVFALPFSYALKRDMIVERACYSDLLHCSMMMMLIVD
jgi:hypothetical protein